MDRARLCMLITLWIPIAALGIPHAVASGAGEPLALSDCHEFYVVVPAPFERVDELVPDRYAPLRDAAGNGQVVLRVAECAYHLRAQPEIARAAEVKIAIAPPEDSTSSFAGVPGACCDWFEISWTSTSAALNKWMRGSAAPDQTVEEIGYRFDPDPLTGWDEAAWARSTYPAEWAFAIDLVAQRPADGPGPSLIVNFFRHDRRERIRFEGASPSVRPGAGSYTVTIPSGTALARLLGATSITGADVFASNALDRSTWTREVTAA